MKIRLIFLILILGISAPSMAASIVSAGIAAVAAENGETTIVDVRSPNEWRRTGIAAGAQTVTIHNHLGIKGFVKAMERAVAGNKHRSLSLICAAGVRSAQAYRILTAAGFTNLKNIAEGMTGHPVSGPGWIKHGLPISTCTEC